MKRLRVTKRSMLRAVVGAVLALVVLGSLGAAYQVVAAALERRDGQPMGEMVGVNGHLSHLYCTGSGSPTVILEHGGGGSAIGWFLLQPQLAVTTRVCAYDRAGLGWSDPGQQPRDGRHIAEELRGLVGEADIQTPFVLVGWSYGGLFAQVYADQYPEDLAGLVLLDATPADAWTRTPEGLSQYQSESRLYVAARVLARFGVLRLLPNPLTALPPTLPPELRAQWRAVYNSTRVWDTTEAESRAILDTMAQVREAGDLGDLPLMIVTAGANQGMDGQWRASQGELESLSSDSVHVTVDGAGHTSLWLDPDDTRTVSAAIVQVVRAVRAGARLNS